MHDVRTLLRPDTGAVTRLARRGYSLDLDGLSTLARNRAAATSERDDLRAEIKRFSSGGRDRRGPEPEGDGTGASVRKLKERLRTLESDQRCWDQELGDFLLTVPNIPLDDVPDGGPEDPVVELRRWGSAPERVTTPRDHVDIGTSMGVLDLAAAAALSGSRFAVTRGAGAALERALASFLLDMHTHEHGYTEYGVPQLVTRETMTGTGQLPKFEEDLFATRVADRDLYLIPTAEVPLVNLFRNHTLVERELPIAVTGRTECFRSEAGSYGRDTRGLMRLHQFSKVELVRICRVQEAAAQLELMVGHAEECLRRLGLHHRVIDLRAGDLGFSARRTYDVEVWVPSQNAFREISSVSDCGTFQGRRAKIAVTGGSGREFAATLNGSALPIGRTLVAILENHQQPDGSVTIPDALVRYTGFSAVAADGRPVPAG